MGGYHNLMAMGITIKDEGVLLVAGASSIDFVGSGVTGSVVGSAVTETISGGTSPYSPISNETPSGTRDGSNKVFTLAHTPVANTLYLTLGGSFLTAPDDYSLSGATITFVNAPAAEPNLRANYYY